MYACHFVYITFLLQLDVINVYEQEYIQEAMWHFLLHG